MSILQQAHVIDISLARFKAAGLSRYCCETDFWSITEISGKVE